MNTGAGLWGTPDYFNACGINGAAPPATFAGTCNPHTGNAMMALVLYNTPYPNYREYLATALSSTMQPGTTYTLSFWLSNGTGIKSPWTIKNIGVCFSSGPLSQTGWGLISATAQCEVTVNIASTTWTQYTFTINPTSSWNYLTIGAFQSDANNNPTLSFTNPGGPASAYANYFLDDVDVLAPANCTMAIATSSTSMCVQGSPVTFTATGGTSYTWSPSSSLSSVNASVVMANPTTTTIYTLTGISNTCTANAFITISVYPVPSISVTPSSLSLCPVVSPTLTSAGGVSYTWQPGNLTGSVIIPSVPAVSTVYTVTGTSSLGCQATNTAGIILYSSPTIVIAPQSPTLCYGYSVSVAPLGALAYTLQPWGLMGNAGTVFTVSPLTTTIYTMTGSSSGGCTASVTGTISVSSSPTININPAGNIFCDNTPVSFTAAGASTYTWFPGGSNNAVLSVSPPLVNSVYTLTGATAQGCTASIVKSLTITPSPTITASSNVLSVCAGGSATLSAAGAFNYTWLPGSIPGQTIAVNPLSTTIYTVTGESGGCYATANVIVANPLSPTISSSGNIDCNNASAQLVIAANSATYSMAWTGPGIVGPSTTSAIIANAPGVYSVVLTDVIANCSATETISVVSTIGSLALSIIPSTTLVCFPGPPINLLVSSSASFTWLPSSQVIPSNGPLVSVSPTVNSTYTVLASLGMCTGSAAITVSVNATPTLVLPVASTTLCAGKSILLAASGANDYYWIPANLGGSSVTVSPFSTVVYTVNGSNYNCNAAATITVNVLSSPMLTASVFPPSICVGDQSTFMASGEGNIQWLTGSSIVPGTSVVVSPFSNATFTAISTNSFGCSNSVPVSVNVGAGPTIFASGSASLVCSEETVTLNVSGAVNYTWLPVNQTGSVVIASPIVSTNYSVVADNLGCKSYTTVFVQVQECIRTTFGVTNADGGPVLSGNLYKINFTVTAVNSSLQNLGNVILNDNLETTFVDPCTYTLVEAPKIISHASGLKINSLFDGSVSNLSLTDPDFSTMVPGKRDRISFSVLLDPHGYYGVLKNRVIGFARDQNNQTLTDTSNNGFDWDPDQDGNPTNNNEITPLEIELIELFIPEGFSPNGDGIYDFFVIKGLNGRSVNISIFNRWGNKVYERDNYDNTWDGSVNVNGLIFGKGLLPEGTYYYVLQFQDGNKENRTGFLVLRHD